MSKTFAQKKEFDNRLDKLGELYEQAKDCANFISCEHQEDEEKRGRLLVILREMRDIAAVSLVQNHEIKPN